jgi:hypothetical protein
MRPASRQQHSASPEVPSPTASPHTEQRLEVSRFASPRRLRLQVFPTSWRLHPPHVCWPYFRPNPPMGFSLQSFAPSMQPYAIPDALALWTLETPGYRASHCRHQDCNAEAPQSREQLNNASRIQTPPSSGLCSTRKSATSDNGLGHRRHVALLGFLPSRVLTLAGTTRPSPRLPS